MVYERTGFGSHHQVRPSLQASLPAHRPLRSDAFRSCSTNVDLVLWSKSFIGNDSSHVFPKAGAAGFTGRPYIVFETTSFSIPCNHKRNPISSAPKIDSRAIIQYLHNRRGNRSLSRFPASSCDSTFNFSAVFSSLTFTALACVRILKRFQKCRTRSTPFFGCLLVGLVFL